MCIRDRYYAACGNATEAARLAGYRKPNKQGPENLVKPGIQAALKVITGQVTSARIATVIERQEFWTAVMRDEKAEMKDRLKASELLGRGQQDFVPEPTTTINNLWIAPETLRTIRETVYGLKAA